MYNNIFICIEKRVFLSAQLLVAILFIGGIGA